MHEEDPKIFLDFFAAVIFCEFTFICLKFFTD